MTNKVMMRWSWRPRVAPSRPSTCPGAGAVRAPATSGRELLALPSDFLSEGLDRSSIMPSQQSGVSGKDWQGDPTEPSWPFPGHNTTSPGTHSTDDPADVSSQNGSGWHLLDEGFSTRNRKAVGSNPTLGSKTAGQTPSSKTSTFGWIRRWQPEHLNCRRYTSKLSPRGVERPHRKSASLDLGDATDGG